MARTNQTIQVTYWQNAKKRGLTPEEKLVELFLMTCPECGASGIFRMDTSSIAYEIGYTIPLIKKTLKSLEVKNRVFCFEGNWVFVRGKLEYEPSKSPKIIKCVENEALVAPRPVITRFLEVYDSLWDTLPDTLSNTLSVTNTITDTISNTITDTKKTPKIKYGIHIKLTEKEYDKLIHDFGEPVIKKKIDDMNEWCGMQGKTYKDYNLAIRNWLRRDGESKQGSFNKKLDEIGKVKKTGVIDL